MKINFNIWYILFCFGFTVFMSFNTYSAKNTGKRTNFLFIICDDLRPELGCYGNRLIKTPNIDKIASHGMVFTHAYVQQAVCAASRASFLTGCRPNTTGVDYPYSNYFVNEFLTTHPTIQRFFYENGYYTCTAGKIHHGGPGDQVNIDITEPHLSVDSLRFYAKKENILLGRPKGRNNLTPPWEIFETKDEAYKDGLMTQGVIKMIGRAIESKRPFFVAVGFHKPHLPFAAPKKYWDRYNPENIPLSPNPIHPKGVAPYSLPHSELNGYLGSYNLNGEKVPDSVAVKLTHGYYACVSYVDDQIGKIIRELQIKGEYENTVIVLVGDHGFHLGDQNNWGKHSNFERATHSPLIIKPTGKISNGSQCDALVEFVDIYPTLAELAGLPVASYLEGTSMVPLLINPDLKWKSAVFSQYPRENLNLEGYAIRTSHYRYVEWKNNITGEIDSRELFQHKSDNIESMNLAYKPEFEEIVLDLSFQLSQGWKKALPPNVINIAENKPAPLPVIWEKTE